MPVEQTDIVLIFVVSAVVVLGLSLIIILFIVFYQKRMISQNEQLQKMEQERQQALLDATIQSQELERKRIAKDLHDEVGAMLSITKLQLGQAIKNTPVGKGRVAAQEAKLLVEETISNVRLISKDLLPSVLENFGLIVALEELTDRTNTSGEMEVTLDADPIDDRLELKVELAIYRIAQELINNTIKHAAAQRIQITAREIGNTFSFTFRDNGRGLDLERLNQQNGLGLRNIDSRVKVIKGDFDIITSLGNGFEFRLTVER